jgi:hypothetical protein
VIGLLLSLLVLSVPLGLYVAIESSLSGFGDIFADDGGTSVSAGPLFGLLGIVLLGVLLILGSQAIISLANIHVGASIAVGVPARIGDALRFGVRRMFPLVGWQLLAAPLYLVGIALCFVPGIWVAFVFSVLPAVVLIERTNAFARCFTLFHRDLKVSLSRIGTIFGITIGAGMLINIVNLPFRSALASSTYSLNIAGLLAFYGLAFLVQLFLPVVIAPLTLAAYADMRARVEPLTSGQIAQELGITAYGGPAVA